jgi:hypothetical protein
MRKTKSDVRHPSSFSTGNIQYANAPFRASCVEKQVARATPTSCIAGFVYVEVRYVTYERVRKEGECETEEGEEKETVELGGHNCVCREKVVDLRKKKFFLIGWAVWALYEQKRIILSHGPKNLSSPRFHAFPNQQYASKYGSDTLRRRWQGGGQRRPSCRRSWECGGEGGT